MQAELADRAPDNQQAEQLPHHFVEQGKNNRSSQYQGAYSGGSPPRAQFRHLIGRAEHQQAVEKHRADKDGQRLQRVRRIGVCDRVAQRVQHQAEDQKATGKAGDPQDFRPDFGHLPDDHLGINRQGQQDRRQQVVAKFVLCGKFLGEQLPETGQ